MVHGKRCARGRRGPRARHAGDSGARGREQPGLALWTWRERPAAAPESPGPQPRAPGAAAPGRLRGAGPDARCLSRDRASRRGAQPAAGARRARPRPALPGSPLSPRRPAHPARARPLLTGARGVGGHAGLLPLPAPRRSESAAPTGRAPAARGARSLGNPGSLPQRAWEFPKGLYLVLAAGNQVFGAGTAQFRVSVSSYLGATSLGEGVAGLDRQNPKFSMPAARSVVAEIFCARKPGSQRGRAARGRAGFRRRPCGRRRGRAVCRKARGEEGRGDRVCRGTRDLCSEHSVQRKTPAGEGAGTRRSSLARPPRRRVRALVPLHRCGRRAPSRA